MKTYQLKIKEHEYGGLGIVLDTGREYFEPALSGLVVAHDILEHSVNPHVNGYIDEFLALGGILAGRVDSGWCTKYGSRIISDDLKSDIESLAKNALWTDEELCPKVSRNYLQSSDMMDEIRSFVRNGIIDAVNEYEDAEYKYIPLKYCRAWICYQAASSGPRVALF